MSTTQLLRSYARGYATPPHLKPIVRQAHATRPWQSIAVSGVDQLAVIGCCLTFGLLAGSWWSLLALPLLVLVAGRFLRALECMVHEASHFNWTRHRRRVNDALAMLLAAAPTGAAISGYRESHLRHHGLFGTDADPDRERYQTLGLEELDRVNGWRFVGDVVRRLPRYQLGWWRESVRATPVTASAPLVWAMTMIFTPAALLGGWESGAWALLAFACSSLISLPVIRLVAESSEHRYSEASTVFDATISNLGFVQRVVFHPHNDGYHTIHHLWPGVPHHRIAWLHRQFMVSDPVYAARLQHRTKVLEVAKVRGTSYADCTQQIGSL